MTKCCQHHVAVLTPPVPADFDFDALLVDDELWDKKIAEEKKQEDAEIKSCCAASEAKGIPRCCGGGAASSDNGDSDQEGNCCVNFHQRYGRKHHVR